MKCPKLIRGTVYILITEGKAGNMSNNLCFREHVTILRRKLFALFSSSCLASVTHEALTLSGKHIVGDVSTIHHTMAFKRPQVRVGALGVGKHKPSSPHPIILLVMCMTESKHGFLFFHRCLPQTAHPHTSSALKRMFTNGWRM